MIMRGQATTREHQVCHVGEESHGWNRYTQIIEKWDLDSMFGQHFDAIVASAAHAAKFVSLEDESPV